MKIAFIDHPAHLWSGSSQFFLDQLKEIGEVDSYWPNRINAGLVLEQLTLRNYDLYVFFQFDFLAYPFVQNGRNVIVIPMVDGSATYGVSHWKNLTGARFISFSRNLTTYLEKLGFSVFELLYFPEPENYIEPIQLQAYFWPRQNFWKNQLQNAHKALISMPEIKFVIRENAAIDVNAQELSKLNVTRDIELTKIENKADHLSAISSSCLTIAPRIAEGIGFAFLEPLSLGRVIVAENYPTMNEYIHHGTNGIIAKYKKLSLNPETLIRMGQAAHSINLKGRENYLYSLPMLKKFFQANQQVR